MWLIFGELGAEFRDLGKQTHESVKRQQLGHEDANLEVESGGG
jgi:hypothetical protein